MALIVQTQTAYKRNPLLDLALAEALLGRIESVVKEWESVPPFVRSWCKGMILYFSSANKEEDDHKSPIGFDDDAEVINACLPKGMGGVWGAGEESEPRMNPPLPGCGVAGANRNGWRPMYEKRRKKFGRDAEIAKSYRAGIRRSELAKRYGVSTAAIDQAIEKAEAEAKRARDMATFAREFAATSRMNQKWPCGQIFVGLGFDARSGRAMTEYYSERCGKCEISMRDLMDTLIPQLTGREKEGGLFAVLPAYRIRNIGRYSYSRMIEQLNRLDLGLLFKLEWEVRKANLRALLAQWKMDVMGDELAEVP